MKLGFFSIENEVETAVKDSMSILMQRLFKRTLTSNPLLIGPKASVPSATYIQAHKVKRTIHHTSTPTNMADITPIQTKEACPGILGLPIPSVTPFLSLN